MNTQVHEHTHVELCTRVLFPSLFLCVPLFLSFLLVTYASLARLAPSVGQAQGGSGAWCTHNDADAAQEARQPPRGYSHGYQHCARVRGPSLR